MAGVKLRDDDWQPLYDAADARDWVFPIEALAFGDQDPEFAEWIDDKDKRASLVDELAVASVLIYHFWLQRRSAPDARKSGTHRERHQTGAGAHLDDRADDGCGYDLQGAGDRLSRQCYGGPARGPRHSAHLRSHPTYSAPRIGDRTMRHRALPLFRHLGRDAGSLKSE